MASQVPIVVVAASPMPIIWHLLYLLIKALRFKQFSLIIEMAAPESTSNLTFPLWAILRFKFMNEHSCKFTE